MRTVDVSHKFETLRTSRAYGRIRLKPETLQLIKEKKLSKGDLVEATKLAGIYGAKRTGDILPFCHPIAFDFASVEVRLNEDSVEVFSEVRGVARTGYEMEALTAVATALLNVYDMCKGLDDTMVIEEIRLLEKSGGKSDWKKDLSGVKVSILSVSEDLKKTALSYLNDLGAVEDTDGRILFLIGEDTDLEERLTHLECVISFYDFTRNPSCVVSPVKVGRDREGRLVVVLPPSRERISSFFETFGGVLGKLV
ncbi:MAG: cyclic pyranopterin monophosphate synthase MoaC [Aquificota bacterium]|nr:cyclic pyranopterin monophosphate synthase MoaC [Aquificota bacterium]